jgi:hypothetical protein
MNSTIANYNLNLKKKVREFRFDDQHIPLYENSHLVPFKHQLINGACNISLDDDRLIFQVPLNEYRIALSQHINVGIFRFNAQKTILKSMCSLKIEPYNPNSWTLITMYYANFFGAFEILRMLNKVSIFIDSHDLALMCSRFSGINFSGGNYISELVRVSQNNDGDWLVYLRFANTGGDTHRALWHAWHTCMSSVGCINTDSDEQNFYKTMLNLTCTTNRSTPSQIRNKWNYSCADLYGTRGLTAAFDGMKSLNSLLKPNNNQIIKKIIHDGNLGRQVTQYTEQEEFTVLLCLFSFIEQVLSNFVIECFPDSSTRRQRLSR